MEILGNIPLSHARRESPFSRATRTEYITRNQFCVTISTEKGGISTIASGEIHRGACEKLCPRYFAIKGLRAIFRLRFLADT